MPYSVAIGNHDYRETGNKNSSTADFRAAFGPQRYEHFDCYSGSYQVTGDADRSGLSHYQYFTGGGIEFLHLNLEFDPTPDVLGWADQVIDRHPSLPVIVSTHSYLNDPDENGQGAGRNGTGQRVWDDLIRENPQVFMVLAGHEHNGIDGQNGEYHQVSLNDDGLEVFEVLANYQDYFTAGFFPDLVDGGEGWMRLMEFDLAAGEIGVQTYFPAEDRFQTDANSAFTLEVDFGRRFFFVPEPSTAGLLLLSSSCLLRRLPRGHDLNVRDT
ncbi:MAG: metallophosphoesterase [Planctomycetota bacterium]